MLWKEITLGGVLAFLFADLIVLPIVAIYRKYYGRAFALRISGLMFVTMVAAALVVAGVFALVGISPTGPRLARATVFGHVAVDYNLLGAALFATLIGLTVRRGATDPVCGMTVDRGKAIRRTGPGGTASFCSEHCAARHDAATGTGTAPAADQPAATASG